VTHLRPHTWDGHGLPPPPAATYAAADEAWREHCDHAPEHDEWAECHAALLGEADNLDQEADDLKQQAVAVRDEADERRTRARRIFPGGEK
jgi:hypothetical protein